jgi:hypothetical protein
MSAIVLVGPHVKAAVTKMLADLKLDVQRHQFGEANTHSREKPGAPLGGVNDAPVQHWSGMETRRTAPPGRSRRKVDSRYHWPLLSHHGQNSA